MIFPLKNWCFYFYLALLAIDTIFIDIQCGGEKIEGGEAFDLLDN